MRKMGNNVMRHVKKLKRAVSVSQEKLNYLISSPVKHPKITMELNFEDTIENHLTMMLLKKKCVFQRGAFPMLEWNKFNRVLFDVFEIQEEHIIHV